MKVNFEYKTSVVIEGKDLDEIVEKWESMPLYTKRQEDKYFAEFLGITDACELIGDGKCDPGVFDTLRDEYGICDVRNF